MPDFKLLIFNVYFDVCDYVTDMFCKNYRAFCQDFMGGVLSVNGGIKRQCRWITLSTHLHCKRVIYWLYKQVHLRAGSDLS